MLASALAEDANLDVHLVLSENVEEKFAIGKYTAHRVLPAYPHAAKGAARVTQQVRYYAGLQKRIGSFLNELKPDVVHTQDFHWANAPLEYQAMRRNGRKLFYTVHNVVMHSMPKRIRPLAIQRTRKAYRLCDLLFVHDDILKTQLRNFLESEKPEIAVTPHGILLQAGSSQSPITAERLDTKRLLFFGLARANKGLDIALDAFSQLEGYELTIAGKSGGSSYWESEIAPRVENLLARSKRISVDDRFIDDQELPDLFNRHSCVLLPYTRAFQSQSGILFLALGARVPVVATDVAALGTTVRRMGIGEVAPPDDPESFARAIDLLHHRDPRELDSRFTDSQDEWSWARCAKLTAEAYRRQTRT